MLMTFTLSWADDGSRLWLPSQAMNKEAAKVKVTCKQNLPSWRARKKNCARVGNGVKSDIGRGKERGQ